MVKKWIFRVLALAVVVFFMLQTKKLFDNIKHGAFSIKSLEELESASLVISDDKITISSDKPKEESKPTSIEEPKEEPKEEPEMVYEPSTKTGDDFYLDLSNIKSWESGEYDKETGLEAEHKRRLRYPELIAIECPKYNIILSEDIKLRICEYNSDESLIRYVECVNGETFEATSEGEFISITLMKIEKEKTMSPGQWGRRFSDGIKVLICTDKWLDYSNEEEGNLVTGSYDADSNLTELLLSGKDDELADAIWYSQIENDIYGVTGSVLNNGNQTYYFSTSEGDDNNSGLSRDNPKKNVEAFSGMSNVNLLLKCGDAFNMTKEFNLGSNCIYAAYGQGRRPVLSFYRDLDVRFTQSKGVKNIWEADLSSLEPK